MLSSVSTDSIVRAQTLLARVDSILGTGQRAASLLAELHVVIVGVGGQLSALVEGLDKIRDSLPRVAWDDCGAATAREAVAVFRDVCRMFGTVSEHIATQVAQQENAHARIPRAAIGQLRAVLAQIKGQVDELPRIDLSPVFAALDMYLDLEREQVSSDAVIAADVIAASADHANGRSEVYETAAELIGALERVPPQKA